MRNARLAIGALVVAGAAIAVYAIVSRQGNPPDQPVAEAPPANGVTRALSTGAMAAFVVKPKREMVADVAFQDADGKEVRLANWKGRVVLLNLWATWCAPCRKEMPELNALEEKLGGRDFEVVALSVDRKGTEASAKFLAEVGANALKLYIDPTTSALNALKAPGLPASILIDRQGREIGRLVGPADWASPDAVKLVETAIGE